MVKYTYDETKKKMSSPILIDVKRQFDFDLREMTQGHQSEGPLRSAIYRKDMQVLLKRPTLRESYHLSRMDHKQRDKFQSDPYTS